MPTAEPQAPKYNVNYCIFPLRERPGATTSDRGHHLVNSIPEKLNETVE